jgi:GH35 family endo-1,4-beta-xylanase
MKIKNIITILLIAFILASCAPAAKVVPTKTAIPTSTFTPIPPTPTITPTPAPENIADAKDLSIWVDEFVHAYGGKLTVNGVDMDANQLADEIRQNSDKYIQTKSVNGIDFSFLVINDIPLAMMNSNDIKWQESTVKNIANAFGFIVGVPPHGPAQEDKRYQEIYGSIANKVIISIGLDTNVVFRDFTMDDWQKILANWESIKASLDKKQLPSEFPYFWDWAEYAISFAENNSGVQSINAQHLLWKDVPDTIYEGNFTTDELEKILEFTTKARVIKYKGKINHWNAVDEMVSTKLYVTNAKDRFWVDKFGYKIVPKIIKWVYEVDSNITIGIVEDVEGENYPEPLKVHNNEFLNFLQFIQQNAPPESLDNLIVGIEGYQWIYGWDYSGQSEKEIKTFLEKISSLGYKVYICEEAVITSEKHPIWLERPRRTASVPNIPLAQADIFGTEARLNFATGGKEIGLGGAADFAEWYDSFGRPDASAMMFDDDGKAKPSYYALVRVLYEQMP